MAVIRTILAYLLSVIVTYILASSFYTQQVIAKMSAVGAEYSAQQQIDTYMANFAGLWQLGAMIAVAFLTAFAAAFAVKRVVKPLAPVAYPIAGAAAILVMLSAIEQVLGGGAGVIGGARDAVGLSLQAFAGLLGGAVFALTRPR
jgi:hypothetical protein